MMSSGTAACVHRHGRARGRGREDGRSATSSCPAAPGSASHAPGAPRTSATHLHEQRLQRFVLRARDSRLVDGVEHLLVIRDFVIDICSSRTPRRSMLRSAEVLVAAGLEALARRVVFRNHLDGDELRGGLDDARVVDDHAIRERLHVGVAALAFASLPASMSTWFAVATMEHDLRVGHPLRGCGMRQQRGMTRRPPRSGHPEIEIFAKSTPPIGYTGGQPAFPRCDGRQRLAGCVLREDARDDAIAALAVEVEDVGRRAIDVAQARAGGRVRRRRCARSRRESTGAAVSSTVRSSTSRMTRTPCGTPPAARRSGAEQRRISRAAAAEGDSARSSMSNVVRMSSWAARSLKETTTRSRFCLRSRRERAVDREPREPSRPRAAAIVREMAIGVEIRLLQRVLGLGARP